jgi:glutaredoxin
VQTKKAALGFDYETVDVSDGSERKAELAALAPDTVAPKFVADGAVYTLDELQEMNEEGRLDALLTGGL